MNQDISQPAFPSTETSYCLRMSLRDYFAGQALSAILVNGDYHLFNDAATDAYSIADAMIAKGLEVIR
jgi:hypothetical protein